MKRCFIFKLGILAMLLVFGLVFSGCTTTAGPFVTNVSSDGQGNLIIEKNMVRYNTFTNVLSEGENPTMHTIRINSGKKDDDSEE